jgi:hypothetical protein
MAKWININKQQPQKSGNYYVKIGLSKRKDVFDLDRLIQYFGVQDDVYWLDESEDLQSLELVNPISKSEQELNFFRKQIKKEVLTNKPINIQPQYNNIAIKIVQNINKNEYDLTSIEALEKCFGIKKGEKIKKQLERMAFNKKVAKIKKQ